MPLARALVVTLALAGLPRGQEPGALAPGEQTVTVRGRAVDEAGQPISGACVALARSRELDTAKALRDPVARSGADGRFEVSWSVPADLFSRWDELREPLITAPGRGAAIWTGLSNPVARSTEEDVRVLGDVMLPRAVVIAGMVRDEGGQPVEGVHVIATDLSQRPMLLSSEFTPIRFVSAGRTDAKGTFVLPGVLPPGAELTVKAEGYHAAHVPFATPRDPLVIEIKKGGFVEGTAYDRDGKPSRAFVAVDYEVGDPFVTLGESAAAGDDGTFRINLALPHRYRVGAWIRSGDGYASAFSEVLAGPRHSVALRPPAPVGDGPAVTVRVIDAQSRALVEGAAAAAFWRAIQPAASLESEFSSLAVSSKQPGEVRLPGPRAHEPSSGTVMVKAEGYAPSTLQVVWDAADPPRLEAKLVRESVVSGVVVDGATGKPVEGARVVVGEDVAGRPWFWQVAEPEKGGRATDGAGRFRLGGLAAGMHTVRAGQPFRPDSEPRVVAIGAGEEKPGIELVIPAGVELSGKITGAQVGAGFGVRLLRKDDALFFAYSGVDPFGQVSRTGQVASDGSFTLQGLTKGSYALELLIPQHHDRGISLVIPVECLQIEGSSVRREFDVAASLPGTIEGRLALAGAPIPPERLAVKATRSPDAGALAGLPAGESVSHGFVAADGAYRLDVIPGEHRLQVIDLATGITLLDGIDPVTVMAKSRATSDLSLELAEVHVLLVSEQEGGDVVASRLEVAVHHAEDNPLAMIGASVGPAGVSLADGKREVTLLLPAVATTLRVHSNLAALLRDPTAPWTAAEPLAEHRLTPKLGEINRIELVVEKADEKAGKEK